MKNPSKTYIRILAFLAVVAVTVYFLPRSGENHYTYEVNRPWSYALLTAPFDIPVHLDSVSAQLVRDSVDRDFEPVYKRDVATEKLVISDYAVKLNTLQNSTITPTDKNRLLAELKKIFDDGIVDRDTYTKIAEGRLPAVRFIVENMALSMPTTRYRSSRSAYSRIDSLFRDPGIHNAIMVTKLAEVLQPNITLDTAATKRLYDETMQKAMAPVGVIQQGERIIDRGDIVTPRLDAVLSTYEELADERGNGSVNKHYYPIVGQALYMLVLMSVLYIYLFFFRRDYFNDLRTICLILSLITIFALLTFALHAGFANGGLYLVPLTILPIMLQVFLDSRTAFMGNLIEVLTCALIASFPLEFIFLQTVAGMVAITSLKDLSRRSQLIRAAAFVFLAYGLCYVAIEVIHSGSIERISTRMFGYLAVNAVFISFSYILMFLFERGFGFTSRVTLVELSDINNPLLRELSEECPGTFQHSMAVSNLSSAAAHRIGANVQLVRAGALYHDIGKIKNPAFYTENQHGVNPHDALNPIQSARVVTGHVAEGIALADKAKLPAIIKDFIREHHGAGRARYFYTTYCNSHPGEQIDDTPFRYPGPNPRSRETSILMMADAVEAASRSLTDHSPEAISALVNKIIDSQVAEGLHNDSPLSFRDVKEIKEEFARRLRTMYHSRISYPDLKTAPAPQAADGEVRIEDADNTGKNESGNNGSPQVK